MRSSLAVPVLALGAVLAAASLVVAQEPLTGLEGFVADSATGRPVAGVLVRMDSGRGTVSDELGRFRIVGVDGGEHLVALLTPRCRVSWHRVALVEGQVRLMALTVAVDAPTEEERVRDRERRGLSQGAFLDAADIEAMQVRTLADVVRRVAPRMVGGSPDQVGASTEVRSRSTNSFTPSEPVVVVDGARVSDGGRALDLIAPSDVETLEVLPGAAAGWEFGSDGAAGVIRVTTRYGDAPDSPDRVGSCQVPDFPTG